MARPHPAIRRESQAPLSLMGSLLRFLHRERSCPSPGWFPVPSKASRPWEWHPTPQLVRIPPIKLISVPRAATAFPLSPLPLTIYVATVLGLSVQPARDDVEPVSPNSQTDRVVRMLDQVSNTGGKGVLTQWVHFVTHQVHVGYFLRDTHQFACILPTGYMVGIL
ncbi:hypothetical protein BJ322DRAFT_1025208 [Thelephora terrestris]|uniref:Uncharacterized protein n=1 Tax=Thelephora terrestris TaxID=56493 RepID=A0A9P6H3E3_9AGAM|nr:hypothetical protein BJ322DRAFT_1025208 [Thelephora terrestris]